MKTTKTFLPTWIDRLLFLMAIPGILHFIYYTLVDQYSDAIDSILGTQFDQLRPELKRLIDENALEFVLFHYASLLIVIIYTVIYATKKVFASKLSTSENDRTKVRAAAWVHAVIGFVAPYLVCVIIHGSSSATYSHGHRSEIQQIATFVFCSVLVTAIVGYIFVIKLWLKLPLFNGKRSLLVVCTIVHIISLYAFIILIYITFGGPAP